MMRRVVLALLLLLPLRAFGADVVGKYYQGDGLGVNWNLSLTRDHRFTFEWTGCLGVYGSTRGTWRVEKDRLYLTVSGRPEGMADKMPRAYVVVSWGPRTYLVDDPIEFCNQVNGGWEPRDHRGGMVFLRDQDWNLPAIGRPLLSTEYGEYLLAQPIRAKVVGKGRIDAGARRGLRKGMIVNGNGVPMRITAVRADDADIEVQYKADALPPPGTFVSTGKLY
jgi:hypothetical protein